MRRAFLALALCLLLPAWADAAFKNANVGSGTGATMTVVWTACSANEIAVIAWTTDDPTVGTITYPTGFAEISRQIQTTDGQTSAIAWKRCDGTETGNLDVTGTTIGTGPYVIGLLVFSGRATGSDPTGTGAESDTGNASPVTITATGVTASAGDDLVWAGAPDPTSSGGVNVWTAPTSPVTFTERVNTENAFSDLWMGNSDNVSAGATGNISGSFTLSAGTSAWAAYLVRIPAAAAPGGGTTAMPCPAIDGCLVNPPNPTGGLIR